MSRATWGGPLGSRRTFYGCNRITPGKKNLDFVKILLNCTILYIACRAPGNKAYYENALKAEGADRVKRGEDGLGDDLEPEEVTVKEETREDILDQTAKERKNYEALCRGEEQLPERLNVKLILVQ